MNRVVRLLVIMAGSPGEASLPGCSDYANLDIENAPGVWRDFGVNVARSAANRPWMPALGNHETEFGVCNHAGVAGDAPGGISAQGAAGNYWNGPYGYGHYLSRFLLPDNGVTNWDGNHLRGNFYSFQVGTVKFISLDADDVIYQDGGSAYLNSTPSAAPEATSSGAQIVNGTVTYNHGYTGDLSIVAAGNAAVPDRSHGTPNLQTPWLERTLAEARRDPAVDMIVVFMHQCAMSTSVPGNGLPRARPIASTREHSKGAEPADGSSMRPRPWRRAGRTWTAHAVRGLALCGSCVHQLSSGSGHLPAIPSRQHPDRAPGISRARRGPPQC